MRKNSSPLRLLICSIVIGLAASIGVSTNLQAQVLYWGGGAADITPPLAPAGGAGTWDNTIQNWASNPSGTAYQAWTAGANAVMTNTGNNNATLTENLSVSSVELTQTGNSALTLTAAAAVDFTMQSGGTFNTIHAGGGNAGLKYLAFGNNVNLAGTHGFTVTSPTGSGINMVGTTAHTISGVANLNNGQVRLEGGSLLNITEWNISGSGGNLRLENSTNSNRVSDTAAINLSNGGQITSLLGNNQSEQFGDLNVVNTVGNININIAGNANTALNFGAFDRGDYGVLRFDGSQGISSYNGIVRVASGIDAADMDQSLVWAVQGGRQMRFVQYDSVADSFRGLGSGLGANQETVAPTDLSTWDSQGYTADTNVFYHWTSATLPTGALDADLALRTLAIGPVSTGQGDFNFDLGGNTLTLQAFAFGSSGGSSTQFTVLDGNITSPNDELWLHYSGTTANFNAALTGTNDIILTMTGGTLNLNTENTYTGDFRILGSGGIVDLDGVGTKITGDLYVDAPVAVNFALGAPAGQIAGVVTLGEGSTLGAAGNTGINQTIGGLAGVGTVILGDSGANVKTLVVDADGDHTFSGAITGFSTNATSRLEKSGDGVWILTGDSTYNQNTVISGGTFQMDGTHTNATAGRGYTVQAGGTLAGSGSIALTDGSIVIEQGGFLSPGSSPGTLSLSLGTGTLDISDAVSLANSEALIFELGTLSDLVAIDGSLTIGTGLLEFDDFVFIGIAGFGVGTYDLFTTTGGIIGTLGTGLTGTINGFDANLLISGNSLQLNVIPEPQTGLLVLIGIGVLALRSRKRSVA